jgi:epoxyqueuosine reductase
MMSSQLPHPALNIIIQEAVSHLGFSGVGILSGATTVDQRPLLAWLADGCHGEMNWLANNQDKRLSPISLLKNTPSKPEDYTLFFVTLPYLQPGNKPPNTKAVKIARYAQGADYHHVLRQRLYQLLGFIKHHLSLTDGLYGRAFVDSAPILEKPLAVMAGLGWQGKNTNLIHPQRGSYQFIGCLLINVPFSTWDVETLPPSIPNHCGTCTRCIEACPTEAIIAVPDSQHPGQLTHRVDARRCIAYWTIEVNGEQPIPPNIDTKRDGWTFGCDICQEVCPWNERFAITTTDPAFRPRTNLLDWLEQPEALATLSSGEFKLHFADSPLLRAGQSGLLRNLSYL